MTSMDYNINNYTISELLGILEIDDSKPSERDIMNITNKYIRRFTEEGDTQLVRFFQNIQIKLIDYIAQVKREEENNQLQYDEDEQTNDWIKYETLPQKDPIQKNKITDRIDQVDIYNNNHVPMKREQLGVSNTFNVPVAQDTLNPTLENTISRFVNLDSQFRQSSGGSETLSTDYTLDLSDPLTNVLNMRLYCVQIPFTWYVIDTHYGNTCFWITNKGNPYKISIEPGNYTPTTFVTEIINALQTTGFTGPYIPSPPIIYNSNNGRLTFKLNGYIDPSGNNIDTINENSIFDASKDAYFTFFDFSGQLNCLDDGTGCNAQNISFSGTLGWLMGYRLPIVPIYTTGNKATAVLDLYGTKYFILVIDDYNQNRINNSLVSITELSSKLALPNYYNYSQPYICIDNSEGALNVEELGNFASLGSNASSLGINVDNIANALGDKIDLGYGKRPVVVPSAPRTLTSAQIYTINEIIKNRERNTTYKARAPTDSDIFAIIPIKRGNSATGDVYVEFGGSMQDNKRVYFGPVNVERMRVKLLDDKGFLVNLHGADWSVTLISQNLYQY
jgi:hypothetical protein